MTSRREPDYPPVAPGLDATPWRCRCGKLLGLLDGRRLYLRHRGRVVEATLPARIRCESCGRGSARPDRQTGEATDRQDEAAN